MVCDGGSSARLRRDAALNRERLLQAASELFAAKGLDTSLDDIARAAGVGVATAYRRFPRKDDLIDALFEQRVQDLVDLASRAAEAEDPWDGLVTFLEHMVAAQAGVAPETAMRDLKEYEFIDLAAQTSDAWLGTPGKPGKFAQVLKGTSDFLVEQRSIRSAPGVDAFGRAINTEFLRRALA